MLVDKLFLMLHGLHLSLIRKMVCLPIIPALHRETVHIVRQIDFESILINFFCHIHDLSKNVSIMETLILKIILCQILQIVKMYIHTGFILCLFFFLREKMYQISNCCIQCLRCFHDFFLITK